MFKLMKYEFRKQALSKLVILALVGLIELLFFYGVIVSKENVIATAMGLLSLFTFGALFYIAYESIITYSNDLKQKCSYMLFLTPNSTYGIVGAKVLSAGIQFVLAGIAFFAVFAIDGAILIAKYDKLQDIITFVRELLDQFFQLNIKFADIAAVVFSFITSWISTITVAFFSITLSTTFLANKKFKGVVSFIIFVGLNILYSRIANLLIGDVMDYTSRITLFYTLQSLFLLCFTIITYVGTAWMLDKKVSV